MELYQIIWTAVEPSRTISNSIGHSEKRDNNPRTHWNVLEIMFNDQRAFWDLPRSSRTH